MSVLKNYTFVVGDLKVTFSQTVYKSVTVVFRIQQRQFIVTKNEPLKGKFTLRNKTIETFNCLYDSDRKRHYPFKVQMDIQLIFKTGKIQKKRFQLNLDNFKASEKKITKVRAIKSIQRMFSVQGLFKIVQNYQVDDQTDSVSRVSDSILSSFSKPIPKSVQKYHTSYYSTLPKTQGKIKNKKQNVSKSPQNAQRSYQSNLIRSKSAKGVNIYTKNLNPTDNQYYETKGTKRQFQKNIVPQQIDYTAKNLKHPQHDRNYILNHQKLEQNNNKKLNSQNDGFPRNNKQQDAYGEFGHVQTPFRNQKIEQYIYRDNNPQIRSQIQIQKYQYEVEVDELKKIITSLKLQINYLKQKLNSAYDQKNKLREQNRINVERFYDHDKQELIRHKMQIQNLKQIQGRIEADLRNQTQYFKSQLAVSEQEKKDYVQKCIQFQTINEQYEKLSKQFKQSQKYIQSLEKDYKQLMSIGKKQQQELSQTKKKLNEHHVHDTEVQSDFRAKNTQKDIIKLLQGYPKQLKDSQKSSRLSQRQKKTTEYPEQQVIVQFDPVSRQNIKKQSINIEQLEKAPTQEFDYNVSAASRQIIKRNEQMLKSINNQKKQSDYQYLSDSLKEYTVKKDNKAQQFNMALFSQTIAQLTANNNDLERLLSNMEINCREFLEKQDQYKSTIAQLNHQLREKDETINQLQKQLSQNNRNAIRLSRQDDPTELNSSHVQPNIQISKIDINTTGEIEKSKQLYKNVIASMIGQSQNQTNQNMKNSTQMENYFPFNSTMSRTLDSPQFPPKQQKKDYIYLEEDHNRNASSANQSHGSRINSFKNKDQTQYQGQIQKSPYLDPKNIKSSNINNSNLNDKQKQPAFKVIRTQRSVTQIDPIHSQTSRNRVASADREKATSLSKRQTKRKQKKKSGSTCCGWF